MSRVFSDLENMEAVKPLVSLEDTKTWFCVGDEALDVYLTAALDSISELIRNHTQRYLTESLFKETWVVQEEDRFSYGNLLLLREFPITSMIAGATIYNKSTGRVLPEGLVIDYRAGYLELPASLKMVVMELVRQQMYVFGYETFGTSAPVQASAARSVSIGNLKVDFGAPAGSANAPINLARGAGGLTTDALVPYETVLNAYRSDRAWVAT